MQVYMNYPAQRITIHEDPSCGKVRKHHKPTQRRIQVRVQNQAEVLRTFDAGLFQFTSAAGMNDVWLDISLGSREDNRVYVTRVQRAVGAHYSRLRNAKPTIHCT
jgi:hypothetical protein